ncbi:MAG: hypothetical protein V4439_03855 [Patescibacteria group bacterium]
MKDLILQKDGRNPGGFSVGTVELEQVVRLHPSQTLHRKPRFASPELVSQAIRNNPLETIPRWAFSDELKSSSVFREALPNLKESFFKTNFLMLADMGITFDTSPAEATSLISKRVSEKQHLGAHIAALHVSFNAFKSVFDFMGLMIEKGRFEEKHLTAVYTMCTAYVALGNDAVRGARLMKPIGLQVDFNRERYIFELPTVLPNSNLPEVLLAMPVVYFGDLQDSVNAEDPHVSDRAQFICDAVGSKSFAWFYQMYNRRDRGIKNFPNLDPIPTDYLEFRPQLRELVDLEFIATPYHHVAAMEWVNPEWLAGIDPLSITMHKNIPFFTVMKRWSGSGIFPLLCDLMANTIDHISNNKNALDKFSESTYWYKGNGAYLGSGLKKFAEQVVQKFSEEKVFEFLRG